MSNFNSEIVRSQVESFISSNKASCLQSASSRDMAISALVQMSLKTFLTGGRTDVLVKTIIRLALMRSFNVHLPPL